MLKIYLHSQYCLLTLAIVRPSIFTYFNKWLEGRLAPSGRPGLVSTIPCSPPLPVPFQYSPFIRSTKGCQFIWGLVADLRQPVVNCSSPGNLIVWDDLEPHALPGVVDFSTAQAHKVPGHGPPAKKNRISPPFCLSDSGDTRWPAPTA